MGTLSTRKLGMAGLAIAAFAGISLFSAGEASALTINSDLYVGIQRHGWDCRGRRCDCYSQPKRVQHH